MNRRINKFLRMGMLLILAIGITACGSPEGSAEPAEGETEAPIVVDDRGVPTLVFPVPEGFVIAEGIDGNEVYYTESYPEDTSNMVVKVYDHDAYGVNWDEETFQSSYEAGYEEAGTPVSNFTYIRFEKGMLENEYETLLIDYTIEFNSDVYRQIEHIVQLDTRTYVQTYTQLGTQDTDHMNAFLTSIARESVTYDGENSDEVNK
ncbi:MAG: hypothetical protein KBS85_00680 [Lachnospiraceae bacterium]|nr:hypothetical protein [Candidatus Merdinaster equi]